MTLAGNPVIKNKEINGKNFYMTKDLWKEVNYFIYMGGILLASVCGTRTDANAHFERMIENHANK